MIIVHSFARQHKFHPSKQKGVGQKLIAARAFPQENYPDLTETKYSISISKFIQDGFD
jgi:hypothetical protein